jgi:hypothetical protein
MTTITADISSISRVPVLRPDGSNWPIFKTCFRHFAKSKSLWEHFIGTSSCPAPPAAQAEIDEWQKKEDEAHNYLAQRLEDTTLLLADEFSTVAEMWEWISNELTALSSHVIASMQAEFDGLTCGKNGNVHTHLEQLQLKYKALVAVGVKLSDSQYAMRIINSLLHSYQCYLSTISSLAKAALMASNLARTAAAQVQTPGTAPTTNFTIMSGHTTATHVVTLSPGYLMHLAIEEWDQIEAEKKKTKSSHKPREDVGVALSAQIPGSSPSKCSGGGNGGKSSGKGNTQHPKGVCWNCGGKGHVQSKCPSPKQEAKPSASGSTNTAVEFDDDGAWSVEPVECVPDAIDSTVSSGLLRVAPDTVFDMEDLFENWESCPELALMTVSDSESILGADADCHEYLLDVWPQLLDLEVSDGSVPRVKFLLTEDDKYSNFNWSDSDWDAMPLRS